MSQEGTPLDRAIRGIYESVSGPAGAPRDWDRLRALHAPNARIMILHRLETGGAALEMLTMDQYQASREPYFDAHAFHETEVDRETSIRGNLAHVYSEFEARRSPGGPVIMSGYNSIQLVLAEGNWRIVSVLWEAHAETPKLMSPGIIPIVDDLSEIRR